MEIGSPEGVFGVKEWQAEVVSNYNVATYIKEFIVEIPEDMNLVDMFKSDSRRRNEIFRY